MVFSLAQDFRDAVATMPREHPKHQMLELLEEAIRRDIHFVARHPTTLFQCMWNRVIADLGSRIAECGDGDLDGQLPTQKVESDGARRSLSQRGFCDFFEAWRRDRRGCPYWLQANAPLPGLGENLRRIAEFTNPSPIQTFCAERGLLAVVEPSGVTEIYAVPSGTGILAGNLNAGAISAVAIATDADGLVFRRVDGVIGMDGCSATLQGRRGETHLLVRPNGSVVSVNEDNALVAWFPRQGRAERLAANIPFPLRILRNAGGGNGILFVAGAREQQIGIVTLAGERRKVQTVQHSGPEIIDADTDVARDHVALLLKNRSIRITDLSMTRVVAEIPYQRAHPRLAGAPLRCCLRGDAVYFVTSYGHVGRWDCRTSSVDYLASCYEKTEHQLVAIFDGPDNEPGVIVSFPTHAVMVGERPAYGGAVRHEGRPTQCILYGCHSGVASVSEDENTIRWFSINLTPAGSHAWPKPICVAYDETTEELLAGNNVGFVLHLPLSDSIGAMREYRVSSQPIVGIVPRAPGGCVAIDATGQSFVLERRRPPQTGPAHRNSFATQVKVFSSRDSGDVWSLREAGNMWTVARGDRAKREDVVVTSRSRIWDASVSPAGTRVCVAGDRLALYEHRQGTWLQIARISVRARTTTFVGNEFVAVVLLDRDTCVEIRSTERGLAPVATIDLEHRVLCLGTDGSQLVVGLESGHLVSMSFQGPSQTIGDGGGS